MRIMIISGNDFQFGKIRGEGSYYFSKYAHIWGWATWRRAWKYYNLNMKNFEKFKKEAQINNIFNIKQQKKYRMKIFQLVYDYKINTWDYIWTYACLINNGLCVMPNVNLVSNIGFSIEFTHTQGKNNIFSNMKVNDIKKVKHPNFILVDQEVDNLTSKFFLVM